MSTTEILRQCAAATNETRVEHLAAKIEAVRQAKLQSVEELASMLEPLAQALAALTDETRRTLTEIELRSREQAEEFRLQIDASARSWREAAAEAQQAAESMYRAGARIGWRHYGLTVATGLVTATLVSAFWLWRAPPVIWNNVLDTQSVARLLKPAIIAALRPSRLN